MHATCGKLSPSTPNAKYIADVLGNEELPNSRYLPLTVSQGSTIENANCSNVPGDGANGFAFTSVHFGDLLVCQNERSTVSKFADIVCLAEEVIINSPLQFNPIREKSWQYDISEAYALLQEFKVVERSMNSMRKSIPAIDRFHIVRDWGEFSACRTFAQQLRDRTLNLQRA